MNTSSISTPRGRPFDALLTLASLVLGALQLAGAEPAANAGRPKPSSDWWSLRPLTQPAVPVSAAFPRHPVDAFITAALEPRQLKASPTADRRTLIRRLYFDLLGLPPTPAEIDAFLQDPSPSAYEQLVDRLLESPHYGERWARHWLDVVHFGETHGYDKDQPRPNAWPYRDYVIRAFNEDKPYGRFVQEQIAGDVLYPDTQDGVEALGFIAAGPWDLIGHAEVPESKMDGQVARHLDRDDMVVNTLQTFNSLTVQCAQCHNHKFDPISQEEYYSLQSVFAAVDRADRKYDVDPRIAAQRRERVAEQTRATARQKELEAGIRTRAGTALSQLEESLAAAEKAAARSDAMGFHSQIEKRADVIKWVQVDLGRALQLSNVVLHPCQDSFNNIGDGFGFPVRFKVEADSTPEFRTPTVLADLTQSDVANPGLKAQTYSTGTNGIRYLRVTARQLALRQDDYIFALAELEAITPAGTNAARGATVTALDSIEAPVRWQKSNLTDGWYPGIPVGNEPALVALKEQRRQLLESQTLPEERDELARLQGEQKRVKSELERLPSQRTAYIGTVHTGSGNFIGTGAKGGKPRTIHLLNRGNLQMPGKETGPGTLNCVSGLPGRFELPDNHAESDRRATLARWLTDPRNPLTWRSIVNRVWQYHFGRGLVETPNDFGHMGALPSHPELLDWLAAEFRDHGQSIKRLHRLILTSATYQQSSAHRPDQALRDGDNRYLWRMNRRRLEAEAVRDSVLRVSGRLNPQMGGPSFKDFVVEKPEHSPHYEYHLHRPDDPASQRRSIYRFIVRSQPQPFLTTLDCADPSMQVARRNETISPLQALALLNNPLILHLSTQFAARLTADSPRLEDQVRTGHLLALGRPPAPGEEESLRRFATTHGLTNYCRLLFNLNEFSFVD